MVSVLYLSCDGHIVVAGLAAGKRRRKERRRTARGRRHSWRRPCSWDDAGGVAGEPVACGAKPGGAAAMGTSPVPHDRDSGRGTGGDVA